MESPEELKGAELQSFRDEMRVERERQIEQGVAHLEGVIPDELTDDDRVIWEKAKMETLDKNDLAEYEKTVIDAESNVLPGVSRSRVDFMAFIRNKATVIFGRRALKEMKK